MKKEKYYNKTQHDYYLNQELFVLEVGHKIIDQATKALGEDFIIDYKELLNDAAHYISEMYFIEYALKPAAHIVPNKFMILEHDTGINIAALQKLNVEFNQKNTPLGEYAIKVTKEGLESTIKRSSFEQPLSNLKGYEITLNYIDAANKLLEYHYKADRDQTLPNLEHTSFKGSVNQIEKFYAINKQKFV